MYREGVPVSVVDRHGSPPSGFVLLLMVIVCVSQELGLMWVVGLSMMGLPKMQPIDFFLS